MARVLVTARLDGTDLTAQVVAIEEYGEGGRTATASLDVPEHDLGGLTEVLVGLADKYGNRATGRARMAAAKALEVAVQRGEEVV